MAPVTLHAGVLRKLYPRVLAKTLALTRKLTDAEDAVQDALERALKSWPETGVPESPEAWLVTVAANAYRDRLRRVRREELEPDALETLAQMSPWARVALGEPEVARTWKDELLRLLFACCHPALQPGECAALALATVVGLSTSEIAAAFVVSGRTMEQRLTRARQRLRDQGEYDDASFADGARVPAVLTALHLLFNEGYWSSSSDAPIRSDLCRLALGLCRSLHDALPQHAEVTGLLALMMLHEARRGGRLDASGEPLPLPEQDRTRWDYAAVVLATKLLESTLASGTPGPFQIEAAISAIHSRAASADETDWQQISTLYALLENLRATPAVRVNRAYAVSRAQGPTAGLALLDEHGPIDVESYPYVHLVRGTLLAELDRSAEARVALARAEESARNAAERAQIRRQLERLSLAHEGPR
ncbi:MAG TPA: sigma-70 family RNA polymerase sigma factor [Polyangiaceae bacterium]|jgi:RNA polymerase sigma-70 factor (ECF subfamily)